MKVTEPPAGTLVVLFVMVTATGCDVLCELPLHPNPNVTQIKNANAIPILEILRCIDALLVSKSLRRGSRRRWARKIGPRELTRRENDGNRGGSIQLGVKPD
jgi:hypothetical protein